MKSVADDCAAQLAAKRAASTCADGGTASDPMRAPAGALECGIAANAQNGTQERAQTKYEEEYAQVAKDAQNGIQEPVARFGRSSMTNAGQQTAYEQASQPVSQVTEQPPQPTEQTSRPAKKLTIAEVRKYVSDRTRPDNRAQIKAIINSFGVAKLTELPEDQYVPLMEKVAKL